MVIHMITKAELKSALEASEMPASEIGAYALRLLDELEPSCPHWSATGCTVIDVCTCDEGEVMP